MKQLLALVMAASFATVAIATEPAKPAETKKVCITTKDPKTGKDVEKCKMMKKHEKHEGTQVPDGKKK